MSPESVSIITTIITVLGSVAVAFITLYINIRKDRQKQTEEIKEILADHREEYIGGIQSVKDMVTKVESNVDKKVGIIEYEIKTLSDRVDKHNNIIERTYALEKDTAVMKEQIERLEDK